MSDVQEAAVASAEANAKLEHTEGGTTTRQDATDAGVPMLPGSPDEKAGPEDAFGEGPKRGNYADRAIQGPHLETVPVPDAKPIVVDGQVVDHEPTQRLVGQVERASDVGDVPGVKGGVETTAADSAAPAPEDDDERTVEELQDELRARDLPVSGTKAELVARLEADDAGEDR